MAWQEVAKVAKKAGPLVLPVLPVVAKEAQKIANKATAASQDKKRAHAMAWQCHGKMGQIAFADGTRRWVVASEDLRPIASIPAFQTPEALAQALAGVDLERCLTAPKQELKAEKAAGKAAKKASKKGATPALPADVNGSPVRTARSPSSPA